MVGNSGSDTAVPVVRTPVELRRGRFTLAEILGEGAFGTVQKASYAFSDNGMQTAVAKPKTHILIWSLIVNIFLMVYFFI